ncbi:hypothetical protein JL09_g6369 [Pichia kudriavzevii]|uniref:Uncharacterized protein n=1 Tax=Pichia kudriavzevii TaxID=4909 RepID=A0A099NQZ7_PICKU|nr:hypothetical protein JL09_g6369 [Pichia kudriavzevii]
MLTRTRTSLAVTSYTFAVAKLPVTQK